MMDFDSNEAIQMGIVGLVWLWVVRTLKEKLSVVGLPFF